MFKKKPQKEESTWKMGWLSDEEAADKDNLPMLKHAYEAVLLNYKDLQQSYTTQQNRTIETCKWVGGFYTAFIIASKDILLKVVEQQPQLFILLIGIPFILFIMFWGYMAKGQHPIGNGPSKLLNPQVIKGQEGIYYFYITVGYEERINHIRQVLNQMTLHYKICVFLLFVLFATYAGCLFFGNIQAFFYNACYSIWGTW